MKVTEWFLRNLDNCFKKCGFKKNMFKILSLNIFIIKNNFFVPYSVISRYNKSSADKAAFSFKLVPSFPRIFVHGFLRSVLSFFNAVLIQKLLFVAKFA